MTKHRFSPAVLALCALAFFSSPAFGQTVVNPHAPNVVFIGNVNVGTGQTYTSLTNTGGLFEAINAGSVGGNTTISITSNLTGETGAVALNQFAGTFTVTIKPSGAARTITSTATATGLITLNGADRVTIDGSLAGGTDRSLSLINSNATAGDTTVVALTSLGAAAGATNVTIKNCVIQNGTTFNSTITATNFGISAAGADHDNLMIQNNLIQRAKTGIQVLGDAAGVVDNLVIQDNTVGGALAADFLGLNGVIVGQATGAQITRNTVRNILFTGIYTGVAGGDGFGILLATGCVNSSVTRNAVNNLRSDSQSPSGNFGWGMTGISVQSNVAASGVTVATNYVYDIRGAGSDNNLEYLNDTVVGIRIGTYIRGSGGGTQPTGGVSVYNNSVNLSGAYVGPPSSVTAAFMVHNSALNNPTGLDVRGNIFANTSDNTAVPNDNTTTVPDKNYAIYLATRGGGSMWTNHNYNDYYVGVSNANFGPNVTAGYGNGSSSVGGNGSSGLTATMGTAEAQSVFTDPLFISPTNLHIASAASPVANRGTPIAGITTDFDGDPRHATSPYMGADELVISITTAGTLSAVDTVFGTASSPPTSFTLSGTNIWTRTSPLPAVLFTVTAPSGYEISTSSGTGYAASLSLTPVNGAIPNTTIYVRLTAFTAVGTYSGNIVVAYGPTPGTPFLPVINVPTVPSTVSSTPPRTVTAISPAIGNALGNDTVTITGTNFTRATDVSIGGTPVLSFSIVSATSITAVTAPHATGPASVIVSNGGLTNEANTLYTYLPPLYTQAQFDANYAAGQNNVINSPNTYNLYTLSQVQSLNVGVPLLVKDTATGKFKLTIAVRKSPNLMTTPFTLFPMNGAGMTSTINAQGTLDFVFPAPGNAAFFRLESSP